MPIKICNQIIESMRLFKNIYLVFAVALFLLDPPILLSQESLVSVDSCLNKSQSSNVIYRNPRVYNVDYSFEIFPDSVKIDRDQDLKVWIPIPREWDSQKAVKIISVEPEPNAKYEDPEFGNPIYFWDFGKGLEKESYEVKIKYRLESFEVHCNIEAEKISNYDKNSEKYQFYTRSSYTTNINSEIKEFADRIVGNEKNAYLQAKRIFEFVRKNMHFKNIRRERGSSIESILNFKVTDPKTGEQYYEGECDHYSILFVALCRAAGIPARGVTGMVGWGPWITEKDLVLRDTSHTMLTADGLAATRLYGPMGGHIWAEFYLPKHGWIPVDPTWGRFGYQGNHKLIFSKGRDVLIGTNVPQKGGEEYGDQWIPLHEGRANAIGWGVWNITKIRIAKAKVLQTSDPFPADALADYKQILFSTDKNSETLLKWRNEILSKIDYYTKDIPNRDSEFSKIYNEPNWIRSLQYKYDTFVCYMLHKVMGEEKFSQLSTEYEILLANSSMPIETSRFIQMADNIYGEPLEWFFEQWGKTNGLSHLRLDEVMLEKNQNSWKINGKLIQSSNSLFKLPVEFSIETEKGTELHTIWQRDRVTSFEFQTENKPIELKVDANNDILKLQKMPSLLSFFWENYPNIILIYGTISESEANKTAAERFNNEYLGLSSEIIKPDTSITHNDLNTASVILFGRPITNKISKRFENTFPIKFNQDNFSYNGINYAKTSQGVAQIIEHPFQPKGQFILYAGLSATAMLQFGDLYLYDASNSFIIYDGDQQINSGDWEGDADLIWKFEK